MRGGSSGAADQLFRVVILLQNEHCIAHITVKARRRRAHSDRS